MNQSLDYRSSVFRPRRGSLIIESVVAIALLATAFLALGNLAASSAAISRNADQRLAATLAAENVLERLRDVPFDALAEKASELGKTIPDSYGYEGQIETNDFRGGGRDAIHLAVTIRPNENVSVTLHGWRIDQSPASEEEDGDE